MDKLHLGILEIKRKGRAKITIEDAFISITITVLDQMLDNQDNQDNQDNPVSLSKIRALI
jgi:hypothetical protein